MEVSSSTKAQGVVQAFRSHQVGKAVVTRRHGARVSAAVEPFRRGNGWMVPSKHLHYYEQPVVRTSSTSSWTIPEVCSIADRP
jgi:hypothetical protein